MGAQDRKEAYVWFCLFLEGHKRDLLNMCRLSISPSQGKAAFHWKSPLLLHEAQQSSLSSHCQKGLRTFYSLYMQLSQDTDWPLTFCKKFPCTFASPKFLRMWLLCFVFAMGSFPYFSANRLRAGWEGPSQVPGNILPIFPALVISYLVWTQAFTLGICRGCTCCSPHFASAATQTGIEKGEREDCPPHFPSFAPKAAQAQLAQSSSSCSHRSRDCSPNTPAERKGLERGCWDDRSAGSPNFTPLCFLARQKSWLGAWESQLLHEEKN